MSGLPRTYDKYEQFWENLKTIAYSKKKADSQDEILAAIDRLVEPGAKKTLEKIVDIAYADWTAERLKKSSALPPNHYRLRVTYAPLPSLAKLRKKWGKDNVSTIFDGRSFSLHASCIGMDRKPGERTFYVHDAGGDWESEEQIAWGISQCNAVAPNGYRPATHEETYEFAEAHTELVYFVGLGSFALYDDSRYAAHIRQNDNKNTLGDYWFDGTWLRRNRILFISK